MKRQYRLCPRIDTNLRESPGQTAWWHRRRRHYKTRRQALRGIMGRTGCFLGTRGNTSGAQPPQLKLIFFLEGRALHLIHLQIKQQYSS
ncbi:hypothetical protein RRG08_047700 [Elysia crispata]|uniref:Uncharacterized protein n=1 Tax=Elysia crispata TaxID=231223 RepID=A0AAE1B0B2_9GAST|nr:hypothetical protein RRG08_047700 [Elysia crispata]